MLVTSFKDNLIAEQLQRMGLNERQVKAVLYVKEKGNISNADYQKLFKVARNTASEDWRKLVEASILKWSGARGASAFYTFS